MARAASPAALGLCGGHSCPPFCLLGISGQAFTIHDVSHTSDAGSCAHGQSLLPETTIFIIDDDLLLRDYGIAMRHRDTALLLLSVILLCIASFAEEKPWREIQSPHFRVITNGSEGSGRHVAREFEQMRAVFASQFPGYRLEGAEPIIIMAPADETSTKKLVPEYWKHGGPKPAGIYFHTWEQSYALVRLDAVGSDLGSADEFAVVYHEYVHSLLHLNLHWLPTWLDEGLAEFYAYTRFEGNRTYIGAPPRNMGALSLLRFRSPIPLAKFLDQRGSFTKNEEDTELYYAQCWAMTHYLTMGNGMEGGARLKKFFNAIQQGIEQKKAFQDTFGELGQVQKNFGDYIHLFAFQAGVIATPANFEDKASFGPDHDDSGKRGRTRIILCRDSSMEAGSGYG